ncbi:tRNA1(Val) (adenine(37)-N6)-methyltransferase [Jiella mangrovi]|uniref:Methyltransferase n=1 Tax=Jiella mangrovi TaxID=2821407 RepID=A0ABS4BJ06_9HYPH|nr:methyltransferase [Jiella mangrovi]MBP0616749.1 methyltransferase [Jiella mangrovi]
MSETPATKAEAVAPVTARIDGRPVRLDAFYDGAFAVFQPQGWGYRSGLDALLLAACVPHERAGRIADLGAGSGVVGFAAAHRAPGAAVMLAEAEPVMVELCRSSIDQPQNLKLSSRLSVATIDIGAPRKIREAAGLPDSAFDLVLTNPPFHPANHRRTPDPVRDRALFASADMTLDRWVAVAAALLAPGGRLVTVLRGDLLAGALKALRGGLGGLTILPVHTKEGAPAERVVIAAKKGSRAPLKLLAGIVLNDAAGRPTALCQDISKGTATLDLARS